MISSDVSVMQTYTGWILNITFEQDLTHIWLKDADLQIQHLQVHYQPKLYVDLQGYTRVTYLKQQLLTHPFITKARVESYYKSSEHKQPEPVLELDILSPNRFEQVVQDLHRKNFVLYNADLHLREKFFLDTNSFAFGRCQIQVQTNGTFEITMQDSSRLMTYPLPDLTALKLRCTADQQGRAFPRWTDPLIALELEFYPSHKVLDVGSIEELADEVINFGGKEVQELADAPGTDHVLFDREKVLKISMQGTVDEEMALLEVLHEVVQRLDPDLLMIVDGDQFTVNYLAHRVQAHDLQRQVYLGRLQQPMIASKKAKNQSYFSYGQVLNRNVPIYIPGRIHLDINNSFFFKDSGLFGLIELTRLSGVPPDRCSRNTIGTVLTAIEFKVAAETIPPILVPEGKAKGEVFKDSDLLLAADNGGITFPAQPGIHEQVWGIDFTSLYPSIMLKYNISSETVLCDCCKDDPRRIIVPDVGYHVCIKRKGVVPRTMEIIMEKRLYYKYSKQECIDPLMQKRLGGIDSALKWILVSCLDGSTPVLIKKGENNNVYRLDVVVENFEQGCGWEVLGIDERGNPEFKPIRDVIKVKPQSTVYSVKFEGGANVIATADHLWPTLQENGWTTLRTDELTKEDWIPRLEEYQTSSTISSINLVDWLSKNLKGKQRKKWRVKGKTVPVVISKHFNELKEKATTEYTIQAVYNWKRSGIIPIEYFTTLEITEPKQLDLKVGSGKLKGGLIQWINGIIPIDRDLGYFLGFVLGDGSIGSTVRINVELTEKQVVLELQRIIKRLWNLETKIYKESKANMVAVQINSRALCFILKEIFGLKGSARKGKLKIPEVVWNGGTDVTEGFLAGLHAADGAVGTTRLNLTFNTSQKSFAEEIGMLLSKVGLPYRIYTKDVGMNKVELRDKRAVLAFKSFGFITAKHKVRIQQLENKQKHERYPEWPTEASGLLKLARKSRKTRNPRITQRERISKENAITKCHQIRQNSGKLTGDDIKILTHTEKLLSAPITFTRVRSIEPLEKPPKYVYCLELDSPSPWFMIQGGLITHNCFGYLGFKNARWGSIESHQCVTAYARQYLIEAQQLAMEEGFYTIAGLTDSLYIQATRPELNSKQKVQDVARKISRASGVAMNLDGHFNWIVFANIRDHKDIAALNRYFGAYCTGEFKIRGIESRKRSTAPIVKTMQKEMLEVLSKKTSKEEFLASIPEIAEILRQYQQRVVNRVVNSQELTIKIKSTKGSDGYKVRTVQASAAHAYKQRGRPLEAGQTMQYIVRDDNCKTEDRVIIGPEITSDAEYDATWYCKLLEKAYLDLLETVQLQEYGDVKVDQYGTQENLAMFF